MERKNTFLADEEIAEFRRMLLERRKALLGEIEHLQAELASENREGASGGGLSEVPTHPADQGTDLYDREMTIQMIDRQQAQCQEVDAALQRIEDGTFGICEGTGEPIDKRRLKAQPWARYGLGYAQKIHQ